FTGGILLGCAVVALGIQLPERKSWPGHLLVGTLMLGVGNGGVVWAERWVRGGASAVMVAAIPFWMVGIEALAPDGERLDARQLAGLVLGFAGIILLAQSDLRPAGVAGPQFLQGLLALQFSCCGWALG